MDSSNNNTPVATEQMKKFEGEQLVVASINGTTTTDEETTTMWQQPMKGIAVNTIVLSERDEQRTAKMGKIVCCNYLAWFLNSTDKDDVLAEGRMITDEVPFEVQTNKLFTIGEGDTTMALELALRHSQQGDLLFLRAASKFAYSMSGRPGTDPNIATVQQASPITPRTFNHDEAQAKLDAYLSANRGGVTIPLVAIPANTDLEYLVQVVGVFDNPVIALRAAMPDYDTRCMEKEKKWGVKSPSHVTRNGTTAVSEHKTDNNEAAVVAVVAADEEEEEDYGGINSHAERVIAEMNIRKIAGNGWFANGDFSRASKCYAKAIQMADVYLSEEKTMDEEDEAAGVDNSSSNSSSAECLEEITSLLIAALNNLAACHMSKGDHSKAKEVCVRVLEMDAANQKALLRAARASLALHEYEESELCLKRAMEVHIEMSKEDEDADTTKIASFYSLEIAKVDRARRAYKEKEKAMAQAMASRLFSNSSSTNKNNKNSSSSNKVIPAAATANTTTTATTTNNNNNKTASKSAESGSTASVGIADARVAPSSSSSSSASSSAAAPSSSSSSSSSSSLSAVSSSSSAPSSSSSPSKAPLPSSSSSSSSSSSLPSSSSSTTKNRNNDDDNGDAGAGTVLEDEDDAEDNDEEQEDEDDDEDGDGSKRKGTEGEATSTTTTEEQARGEEGEGEVEEVSDSDDDSSTFLYQFVNSIIRLVYSAPSKTDEDTEEASVARVARHAASPGPESTANNEKNKTMWATNSLVDNQAAIPMLLLCNAAVLGLSIFIAFYLS